MRAVGLAILLGESHRRPEFGPAVRELEGGRHNPDDGVTLATEREGLPDYPWVRAEAPLPQSMADDDDAGAPRLILFGQEVAPPGRPCAQHLEEPRGDARAAQPLRLARPGQVPGRAPLRLNLREDGVLFLPVQKVAGRDRELRELREFRL